MSAPERIVIVGAGLAGATAALTLRREGFDGSVTLLGGEPRPPYERPPMSKGYLRGEVSFEDVVVRPPATYHEQGIELVLGSRVRSLDLDRRAVSMANGDARPFDRLLLATGARNRTPGFPGRKLDGVHDLRTVEDCDRLRRDVGSGARAVICGMSFIGSEVAASLRALGVEVTAVVSGPAPMHEVLGEQVARVLAEVHRERGVRLVTDDRVGAIEGDGRVRRVITTGGERLECDLALVAVGVQPDVDLAVGTRLQVDRGIVVDERCRTSVEGVFACGDVANLLHPRFGRMRVEHRQHARLHGRAAARAMLGTLVSYDEVPWFWSEQYEHEVQYAGHRTRWDQMVVRGRPESRRFSAFYLEDRRIRAVVALDRDEDVRAVTPLILEGRRVDAAQLGDESTRLETVGPAPT